MPMKVLHIIGGGDVGGAKAHVLSLVRELGFNIEVKLISLRPGPFADDARAMGIDVEIVRSHNIFADIRKVLQIVRSGKYDIIHSHGAKANMFAAIIKRRAKVVSITTIHSDYRLDYMRSIWKRFSFGVINMIALRFLDFFECVSHNFKEILIQRKFDPGRIFVICNGVDFRIPVKTISRKEFIEKYNLPIKEDDIIVGILARMDPVKGLGTLIDAASIVVEKNPSVKFIIAGDGPERNKLQKKAKELNLTDNVIFPGWITESWEFLCNFDINVLTSYTEGFPYAILEGTRYAKCTVSSDVGGIADLIESGYNGFLFRAGDYNTLAEYILMLASDENLRKTMGERIQKKAMEFFSLEKMCEIQLEIYNTILKEKSREKSRSKKCYDIIISGYYGFNNVGDDAMLQAIINNLRNCRQDLKILVLSKNVSEASKTFNVDAINRVDVFSIYWALRKARLFIYGGGNIIQDNTSSRSLMYYLGTIWLAKKLGLKVMFYGNGIGPVKRRINQWLTKKIVNRVDVITLREEMSLQELIKLEINRPKIYITSDSALTLDHAGNCNVDEIFESEGIPLNGSYAGFSIRKQEGWENYVDVIARTADYVYETYGLKPVFIPMQNPEDSNIMQLIVSRMKHRGYLLKKCYNVAETFAIINKMKILIGMRLHSLIFAATLGVPIIGLVYQPKVEAFLHCVRQEKASAGYAANLDFENLKALVDRTWKHRDELSRELREAAADLKIKALKNAEIAVELLDTAYE